MRRSILAICFIIASGGAFGGYAGWVYDRPDDVAAVGLSDLVRQPYHTLRFALNSDDLTVSEAVALLQAEGLRIDLETMDSSQSRLHAVGTGRSGLSHWATVSALTSHYGINAYCLGEHTVLMDRRVNQVRDCGLDRDAFICPLLALRADLRSPSNELLLGVYTTPGAFLCFVDLELSEQTRDTFGLEKGGLMRVNDRRYRGQESYFRRVPNREPFDSKSPISVVGSVSGLKLEKVLVLPVQKAGVFRVGKLGVMTVSERAAPHDFAPDSEFPELRVHGPEAVTQVAIKLHQDFRPNTDLLHYIEHRLPVPSGVLLETLHPDSSNRIGWILPPVEFYDRSGRTERVPDYHFSYKLGTLSVWLIGDSWRELRFGIFEGWAQQFKCSAKVVNEE